MHTPGNQPVLLEFMGGPFDGHRQAIAAKLDELVPTVALPVNDNVFRMLDGKLRGPAVPSPTVALYELRSEACGWRYHFLGTRRAADFNLESWCV